MFKTLYDEAIDVYPEEVMKSHAMSKKELNGFFMNFSYNVSNQKEVTMKDLKLPKDFYER